MIRVRLKRINPTIAAGGIVHTQPATDAATLCLVIPPTQLVDHSYPAYKKASRVPPEIPPTQLVDRSYLAYMRADSLGFPNPTNAVGGLFILPIRQDIASFSILQSSMNDPPTALVGFGKLRDPPACRLSMNNPPTALVGLPE